MVGLVIGWIWLAMSRKASPTSAVHFLSIVA